MTRAEALADLTAAGSSSEVLGSPVVIDGAPYTAVKKGLLQEEAQALNVMWKIVEGIRLSIDLAALGYQPAIGSWLTVDGKSYEVNRSQLSGGLLKMTLIRTMG